MCPYITEEVFDFKSGKSLKTIEWKCENHLFSYSVLTNENGDDLYDTEGYLRRGLTVFVV